MKLLFQTLGVAMRHSIMIVTLAPALSHGGGNEPRVPLLPRYAQECGACHVAYPPGMLPAASWARLMGGLGQHFGSDATLDDVSVQLISRWLQSHAGTYKHVREEPPQDRITRSTWFVREHQSREVPASLWRHPKVRSASNCAACHTQAAQGRFGEREIQLPR